MANLGSSPSSAVLVARRPGESWSYTGVNDIEVSHRWVIDKFPLVCHSTSKNKIRSRHFIGGGPAEWYLELDTERYVLVNSWDDDDYQSYMHFSLYIHKTKVNPISAECKVSILNNRGKRCEEKTRFITCDTRYQPHGGQQCVWEEDLIDRDELLKTRAKELLVGNRLIIFCELDILLSPVNSSTVMPPLTPPSNNLIADLGSLLEGGQHSDMTLKVERKEFKVHTAILSARSPVFKQMFEHKMRESEEKKVDISDLSADTVQEMLQHIYTGEVSTLEQSAESLLEAADKYDLASLKLACEETLRSKLEVENTARMLMLADKHHADQLKADCMSVIIGHPQEVQESEDWSVLERERQDLLVEAGLSLFKCVGD